MQSAGDFDVLIVGCGFSGATLAERIATELKARVLIVDKRPHLGGNAYDAPDDQGLLIGRYGAHAFHTRSEKIWRYVTSFAAFNDYELHVEAHHQGRNYPLPISLETVNAFYGLDLEPGQLAEFLAQKRVPIAHPANAEEAVLSQVGPELYEAFFLGYTRKQWGLEPRELDASVTQRLPLRHDRDRRYFSDPWQGVPVEGYARLFERMLDHPLISLRLGCDYRELKLRPRRLTIYTGPIDAYYDYRFGRLPYRSLSFSYETHAQALYQSVAIVTYPNEHAYTRIIEHKQLYQQQSPHTVISKEFPCRNDDEPYYPIPAPANRALYQRYRALADAERDVIICGRLGSYQYLNMDQCIGQALAIFEKQIKCRS